MKRSMRIGVVTAWPDEDWHSKRLLGALSRRADAAVVDPAAMAARSDGRRLVASAGARLLEFDALVLVRGLGREGDADVQFDLYRALEGQGVVLVNRIEPLLAAQDKFRTSRLLARAAVPTPPAAVAQRPGDAERALASIGDAVVKPLAGSLGEDVARVADDPSGRRAVRERVDRDGAVYLQAWVEGPGRDLRLFVVGGRVRAAIARHPPPGDFRTNVGIGGLAAPFVPDEEQCAVATAAAEALGLDYAGVDMIEGPGGPSVIEVNGNPSWQGILEATGLDMAECIADHVLGRALRRRMASDHHEHEATGAAHG